MSLIVCEVLTRTGDPATDPPFITHAYGEKVRRQVTSDDLMAALKVLIQSGAEAADNGKVCHIEIRLWPRELRSLLERED